ncbi:MAG: hypothetical protein AAF340_14700 [Pseudomonadota bacterium]
MQISGTSLAAFAATCICASGAFAETVSVSTELIGPTSAPHKISEAAGISPPKGNRVAWEDDRLNPYTGVGTRAGKAKMEMVWSKTVPRYLIDPATGKRLR